ncbi:MAG: hypothetical protein Q8N23_18115 [Archangium sp.]|nr:hypothetical protein [Archangium sp.]MDP3154600.1 hypothetical protein [Archangium sp.]MDP3574350.1 hypothetical protein [Archangium sp.]
MNRWLCCVLLGACAPPSPEPLLEITLAPSQLDALGRTGKVRIVATNGDGTIGMGSVKLEADPGELDETQFELDRFGTATTTLACLATDPRCTEAARIDLRATWVQPEGSITRTTKAVTIGQIGVGAQGSTWSRANCPPEAKLVYVFTDTQTLFSFYPPTKALVGLGRLQCPAVSGARPNSMAVGQDAVAWVGFSDGSMFRVNLRTLSCTATGFTPPAGWSSYGMGFVPDSETSPTEALFIASEKGLARVDILTMKPTVVGSFSGAFAGRGAELTGTPGGDLFGFFLPPATGAGMQLAHLTKGNAETVLTKDFPTITLSAMSFAYAFSSWGSDFYLYTSSDGAATKVTKYSPATDGVETYLTAPAGVRILGAGVSRCGGD